MHITAPELLSIYLNRLINYSELKALINVSHLKLRNLIKAFKLNQPLPEITPLVPRRHTLAPDELNYLVNPASLRFQMDLSLRQRVEAFNRRWPRNPITVYWLRKLYREHRIK
jgi:hypothetical protein